MAERMMLTDEEKAGTRMTFEWDWAETSGGTRLHHIAFIEEFLDDVTVVAGLSCGLSGVVHVPGIFSRLSSLRCRVCCRNLGWPHGVGSPKNDEDLVPLVQARLQATDTGGDHGE